MPKSVPPRFVLPLWPAVDRILSVIHHIRPLRADGSGIVSLDVCHYNGHAIVLNDGSEVKTGDTIIELHLNNAWFKRRRKLNLRASQSPREFLGCFAQDLHFLAQQVIDKALGAKRSLAFQGSTFDQVWPKTSVSSLVSRNRAC